MSRNRSDISYGTDDLSRVGFWTPETPEFLEKREERRNARRSSDITYTQAKANIRRISLENQAASQARRTSDSQASIIDFERLDRARYGYGGRVNFERENSQGHKLRFEAELYRAPSSVPARQASRDSAAMWDDVPRQRKSSARVRPARQASSRRDSGLTRYREDRFGFDYDDPTVDEQMEEAEDTTLRGRFRKARHDYRQRKADRAFARDYAEAPAPVADAPRAALYEGKMGRQHHRATRMQESRSSSTGIQLPAFLTGIIEKLSLDRLVMRPWFAVSAVTFACVLVVATSVYPAAQNLYIQSRQNDQLVAEYQAVVDRNQELEQHVEALRTDEGMEELAHESLGWVKDGEHSVSVVTDGSADPSSDTISETDDIVAGSVPTPDTWYSPVLDLVFGYEG